MASVCNLHAITSEVNSILGDSNLTAYTDHVVGRLESFGCALSDVDVYAIAYAMQKASTHILNLTNQVDIPDGLRYVYIDMVCGEFLNTKHLTGQLDVDGLDFNAVVQQVSEGDTSVTFAADQSAESKFAQMIAFMLSGEGSDLLRYRKLVW